MQIAASIRTNAKRVTTVEMERLVSIPKGTILASVPWVGKDDCVMKTLMIVMGSPANTTELV